MQHYNEAKLNNVVPIQQLISITYKVSQKVINSYSVFNLLRILWHSVNNASTVSKVGRYY